MRAAVARLGVPGARALGGLRPGIARPVARPATLGGWRGARPVLVQLRGHKDAAFANLYKDGAAAEEEMPEELSALVSASTSDSVLPAKPAKRGKGPKFKSSFKRAGRLVNELNLEGMVKRESEVQLPNFRAGDALEVSYKQSTTTERTNVVRGMCIGRRNRGMGSSFRMLIAVGNESMEMIFPLYSPLLQEVKIIQRAYLHRGKKRVRRSKLYYVRDRPMSLFAIKDGFAFEMERRRLRAAALAAEKDSSDAASSDETTKA